MALVEREHELQRLSAVLAGARAHRGGTLLIEGPPGIGKTALLESARSMAEAADIRVLATSATELESDLGFSVVRGLLEPSLTALAADERKSVFAGAAHLAKGPLGLDDDGAAPPLELGSAMHGLYWFCANLADHGPMLLSVDDVHWADEPSLLFLTYLARRASEHPLVICVTTRPADSEPMRRHLTALHTLSDEVLALEPLSDEGVNHVITEVFAADAEPEFTAACAKTSGGNPFLLIEMLTALRNDSVDPTAEQAERLDELRSEALDRSLLARVARLGPDAERVATGAAILGIDAEFGRVIRLTRLDPDVASAALDGLRREGIVATNGRLRFVHPLIHAAIYSDIAEPERGLGHLRAARMLDADGRLQRAAIHLLVAERNADPWVVDVLRTSAAEALRNGAPASASAMLTRALAEPAPEDERTSLHLDLGRALARDGDLDGASVALQQALEGYDDPVERAGIALELGQVHRLAGKTAEALAVLDRTVSGLPSGHHDLEISLEVERAVTAHIGSPADEWIDRVAAAVKNATSGSMPDRMIRVFYAYVAACTGTQPAEEIVRLAQFGLAPPDPVDPPLFLQLGGAALGMCGKPIEALTVLDRALESTRTMGDEVQFGFVSLTRGLVTYRAGRVRELEEDASAGLRVAVDGALDLPYAVGVLLIALIERGSLAEAQNLLTRHDLDTTMELETIGASSLFITRSRLHRALGRPKEALADIEQCRDRLTAVGNTGPGFFEWRTDFALASLAAGDRDTARDVAAEDLTISRRFGAPREIGLALRSRALAEGGEVGLELLDQSVDVLADSEAELEHAKSLVELGAALRRSGRRADAQVRLRKGLDLASRCGSLATVTRARDELIAAGARPRRERQTGPDSLTASELRVARMAAEGRSNPEIAQALFVTRRTVEVHLTHVYRKLGIDSREALSSALETD